MTLAGRQQRILRAVVDEYVETAEPVGSEWLAGRYDFGCRSATLRSEMAGMSEMGYLVQPHTSAGRIPSDLGYRYYVDRLMPSDQPVEGQEPLSSSRGTGIAVDELVQHACRLLAAWTSYPSVASAPDIQRDALRQVYLTIASPRRVLLVMLFSTGHVEHRLLSVASGHGERSLQRVSNLLNKRLAGRTLAEVGASTLGELPPELSGDADLLGRVHRSILQASASLAESRVFLEGTSQILRQPEFQNVLALEQVLAALEARSILYQVFSQAVLGQSVTVVIGQESPIELMRQCSVITSPYRIGAQTTGFIGVLGPTRMRYDRAVAAVGLMARDLSTLLTQARLA
ncbi:MAG TPA: heat-inducible transcriptional repressor HrcA [Chthonomonadales bacterium]|nr:heat-inducible transcriptional repressor HrcA [Chthonomonadales bacterium]